ncbi:nuclear transport factor 2 family protein [Mangrovimonas sp. AS39]|uniref:nuclear transport factor 2 family protein n=1 Tax=Mangrovimonas futianensis TaxID=2895523 RepID=UPI001E457753|nr:nuclear transport factor 2 family protein [Mangrovimonas futianensis]MCF1191987.1 nuclear transport factor 2 family protein [Mangrovimonas futianensis]MCF1195681.1 nuclear transport factor 2 family protein [Mangrovimonas futianensis]
MKITYFILLLTFTLNGYSQDSEISDKQKIKTVINQFFKSLETRDTLLMKQTTMDEAQIWRRTNKEPIEIDMRLSKDDLQKMPSYPNLKELPLSFEISVDKGIAVAWVPYKFWVEDEFSHCGIDVFTLFKIDGKWKIISAAYTIEIENCEN